MLRVVGSLEQASQHPVAAAIVAAADERGLGLDTPTEVREAMGSGLEGEVSGRHVRAGAHGYVFGSSPPNPWARRILRQASFRSALAVFVVADGALAGAILLADQLRREAPRAIQGLRASGVSRIVMLTGDRAETAEAIGAALDIDSVLSDRDPADKVAAVAVEQNSSRLSWSAMASTTPPPSLRRMSVWPWALGARAHRLKPPTLSSWSTQSTAYPMRLRLPAAHTPLRSRVWLAAWPFHASP